MKATGTLTCPRCGTETPWPHRCDCKPLSIDKKAQGTPRVDVLVQIIDGGHEYAPRDKLLALARQLERELRDAYELQDAIARLPRSSDRATEPTPTGHGEPYSPERLRARLNDLHWDDEQYFWLLPDWLRGELMLFLESPHSASSANADTARLDWLQSQLKNGWGDGFAMHPLDDGSLYPRPWRKALESHKGMEPDLKTKAYLWQPDIRTAIDEAMKACDEYVGAKS